MTKSSDANKSSVGLGYPNFQLSKAFFNVQNSNDYKEKLKANKKLDKWKSLISSIENGSLYIGSRNPNRDLPVWVTLEVLQGGFTTGQAMCSGAFLPFELELAQKNSFSLVNNDRTNMNLFFLTEDGINYLFEKIDSGLYKIEFPEEGAFLIVAWLIRMSHMDLARSLISEISDYFHLIRFYPQPSESKISNNTTVSLNTVGETINSLKSTKQNKQILLQQEAVSIWAPYMDQLVSHFVECFDKKALTLSGLNFLKDDVLSDNDNGVLSSSFSSVRTKDWEKRSKILLTEFYQLRKTHTLCSKPNKKGSNLYTLRMYLQKIVEGNKKLNSKELENVARIITNINCKRGLPFSKRHSRTRNLQLMQIAAPSYFDLSKVVVSRLQNYDVNLGLESTLQVVSPVNEVESTIFQVVEESTIPKAITKKVERSKIDTLDNLIKNNVIKSADSLASILPQITSHIQASGIDDRALRLIYSCVYQAFRSRRSLLLLNLESQVKLQELPWIQILDKFHTNSMNNQRVCKQALHEISLLVLKEFPATIIPNVLIQEINALVKSSTSEISVTSEIAADIFMGKFSATFDHAARFAAKHMNKSIYQRYYDIRYEDIENIGTPVSQNFIKRLFKGPIKRQCLASYCAARAKVDLDSWSVANNGMIIEQQQIITTHNLASLTFGLGIKNEIREIALACSKQCCSYVFEHQQIKQVSKHGALIMLKNTAYAWRQMLFFLSLCNEIEIEQFLVWSTDEFTEQNQEFQSRFSSVLKDLYSVIHSDISIEPFTGWTIQSHPLMPKVYSK